MNPADDVKAIEKEAADAYPGQRTSLARAVWLWDAGASDYQRAAPAELLQAKRIILAAARKLLEYSRAQGTKGTSSEKGSSEASSTDS